MGSQSRGAVQAPRLVVLLGVALAVATLLAPSIRNYVQQRGHLMALREQVAAQQAEVARLGSEHLRWQDDSYMKAQARGRLHFVMPGEIGFVVLGGATEASKEPAAAAAAAVQRGRRPWFSDLWASLSAADRTP